MTPAVLSPSQAAVRPKTDFADWLSPILVKELRQGLQSRLFVSSFVLLQAAMVLFVGLGLISAANDRSATGVFDGFFQVCVWVPLLVFMPARGLRAIGEETRAQTLDLVQLTRLSAFRIVWGKWLALVAQTFLLASAMLPYAVLRYYFGRVDVVAELVWFGVLLIASMVLTAAAVGMSAAHMAVRLLVLLMILPSLTAYGGTIFIFRMFGSGGILPFSTPVAAAVWILCASALYIYFFLELAASKIAPQAENHAARKRTLALALVAIVAVAGWICEKEVFATLAVLFGPIVGFVVLESLCDVPVPMPGICRPFVLRGFMGRMAGRLLYPGWPSGVLFTAAIIAIISCGVWGMNHRFGVSQNDRVILYAIAPMSFMALISPLPLLQLFPRLKARFWPYLLIQAFCVLFFTIAMIIAESGGGNRDAAIRLLAPIPTSALLALFARSHDPSTVSWIKGLGGTVDGLLLIWLGTLMLRQFRTLRKMEVLALGEEPVAPEAAS